jgi:hypothetical protein
LSLSTRERANLVLNGQGELLVKQFADQAVALSVSASHRNIFFDQKMPEVKFDDETEPGPV